MSLVLGRRLLVRTLLALCSSFIEDLPYSTNHLSLSLTHNSSRSYAVS